MLKEVIKTVKKIKWSQNQQLAIETLGQNILVSAGAGSGKTAVLTERIYRLVKEGYPISRFLVLTFTQAASIEMKNRIRQAILNDEKFKDLAAEVENSHIETFDAFALFVVKKYAFQLKVSQDVSIVDKAMLTIKQEKILDQIFDRLYEEEDERFINFINKYTTKDDSNVRQLIKDILLVAELKLDKESFLNNYVETYYQIDYIEKLIEQEYKNTIESLKHAYSLAEQLEDLDDANTICDLISDLLDKKNYDDLRNAILNVSFPNKPQKSASDITTRNYIKNLVMAYRENDDKKPNYGSSKDIKENFFLTKDDASIMIDIAKELDAKLSDFKKEYKAYTFGDIAKLALKAMRIPEIQKEMQNSFDFILVDEYQDTSDIQEEVVKLLSRNNVYMVGDVKQSIYGFRNANCTIFQNKYLAYQQNKGGMKIDLNDNYRSREEIVNAINDIYSQLMNPNINLIDYQNGHRFGYGNKAYDSFKDDKQKYGLKIYQYQYQKSAECEIKEMEIIADDIINKINNHYQVYDFNLKQLRDCTYKDFAIHIDRSTSFEKYRQYFSSKNIPLHVVNDEAVRNSDISYVTKNLLKIFKGVKNNVYDDDFIHGFMSVARSFLMEMNDQELYTVIKTNNFFLTPLYQKVKTVVEKHQNQSTYQILDALFDEFDIYEAIIKIRRYSSNAHKAEIFLSLVKSMDNLGFALEDVIAYFDDLTNYDLEIDFSDNQAIDNSVTLMTMHKSKGLEFPFVYLGGLNKEFYRDYKKGGLGISKQYGLLFPPIRDNNLTNILYHFNVETEVKKDFEERLRLLYVAMTRAKENLIMLLGSKENESILFDIRHAKSFEDIIRTIKMPSVYGCPFELKNEGIIVKSTQSKDKNIVFKEISVPATLIENKKASKENIGDIDQSLLDFGNRIHQLLEVVNFETKDTSFIQNSQEKKYINNVLNCGLFNNVKNEDIRHEFNFFDKINNVHGVIDALLLLEDEIKIIDFKLKKLDDAAYEKQLHVYRQYIKTITNKKISMYLVSAITGEVKEIA